MRVFRRHSRLDALVQEGLLRGRWGLSPALSPGFCRFGSPCPSEIFPEGLRGGTRRTPKRN